jgi:hypothetical protein
MTNVFANEQWQTYSLNPDLDAEKIHARQMNAPRKQVRYLPSAKRDDHLQAVFKDHISTFDEFDREVLYKKLIYLRLDKLKKKYSFLNKKNHHEIMNAFFNDDYYFRGEMRPGQYLYFEKQD